MTAKVLEGNNGDRTEGPTKETAGCCNCGERWAIDEIVPLHEVRHLAERLDIGGTVPAGECPGCGAFVYADKRGDNPIIPLEGRQEDGSDGEEK